MSVFGRFRSWLADRAAPAIEREDSRGDEHGMTIDAQGWIHGPGVIHMPSRRGGASAALAAGKPVCVVRHGTATAWGTGATIARSWRDTYDTHSAHTTIDVIAAAARDAEVGRWRALGWRAEADQLAALPIGAGVLYQHRSLLTTSWHAFGRLKDQAKTRTSGEIGGAGLNDIAIGIEATCVGQVARGAGGRWRGWAEGKGVGHGPAVPDDQVQTIGRASWHTYAPVALDLERLLDAALLERFPGLAGEVTVTPSPYSVRELGTMPITRPAMRVGHVDVDPKRKSDPYPTGASRGAF